MDNLSRNLESKDFIPINYETITKTLNKLKATQTAATYEQDYIPLLGAILDEGESLPEKTFPNKNLNLSQSFETKKEYLNCESIKEIRDQANCGSYTLLNHVDGSHGVYPENVDIPTLKRNCDDGNKEAYSTQITFGETAYSASGEINIIQELYDNGSIEAYFTVNEDFVIYKSGFFFDSRFLDKLSIILK